MVLPAIETLTRWFATPPNVRVAFCTGVAGLSVTGPPPGHDAPREIRRDIVDRHRQAPGMPQGRIDGEGVGAGRRQARGLMKDEVRTDEEERTAKLNVAVNLSTESDHVQPWIGAPSVLVHTDVRHDLPGLIRESTCASSCERVSSRPPTAVQ
jgi:hypothetical protein